MVRWGELPKHQDQDFKLRPKSFMKIIPEDNLSKSLRAANTFGFPLRLRWPFQLKSYGNIVGQMNDCNVAIAGLSKKIGGFFLLWGDWLEIQQCQSDVLCDAMQSQSQKQRKNFAEAHRFTPKLWAKMSWKWWMTRPVDINGSSLPWSLAYAPGTWLSLDRRQARLCRKAAPYNPVKVITVGFGNRNTIK